MGKRAILNKEGDFMNKDLPLGFCMALAQQPDAMKKFSNMTEDEQNRILSEINNIDSKQEMQSFVSRLAE